MLPTKWLNLGDSRSSGMRPISAALPTKGRPRPKHQSKLGADGALGPHLAPFKGKSEVAPVAARLGGWVCQQTAQPQEGGPLLSSNNC